MAHACFTYQRRGKIILGLKQKRIKEKNLFKAAKRVEDVK